MSPGSRAENRGRGPPTPSADPCVQRRGVTPLPAISYFRPAFLRRQVTRAMPRAIVAPAKTTNPAISTPVTGTRRRLRLAGTRPRSRLHRRLHRRLAVRARGGRLHRRLSIRTGRCRLHRRLPIRPGGRGHRTTRSRRLGRRRLTRTGRFARLARLAGARRLTRTRRLTGRARLTRSGRLTRLARVRAFARIRTRLRRFARRLVGTAHQRHRRLVTGITRGPLEAVIESAHGNVLQVRGADDLVLRTHGILLLTRETVILVRRQNRGGQRTLNREEPLNDPIPISPSPTPNVHDSSTKEMAIAPPYTIVITVPFDP